ncbi:MULTISPECIES: hypothetical protein [Acetobacter]|uniref:hypothetical protein n=1 Tax=Acetobacter TaxID=434 RepID=UPI000A3698B9|nr:MULTISPECIES: hypothetical protein [Acetobacter]MBS0959862.1 hypothetical protein [Acetobacter thailandicus]MBS0986724.1 hypothetical protein [Acetobacter thailandicus]OUI87872.1 hypothetical protein HK11_09185 [Acetobacter sp. DmW_043]OUJ10467.1 hypothetical protein HK25_06725 [Acetobacter sp. DsW_059]
MKFRHFLSAASVVALMGAAAPSFAQEAPPAPPSSSSEVPAKGDVPPAPPSDSASKSGDVAKKGAHHGQHQHDGKKHGHHGHHKPKAAADSTAAAQ